MKEFEVTIKLTFYADSEQRALEYVHELQHGRLKNLEVGEIKEVDKQD